MSIPVIILLIVAAAAVVAAVAAWSKNAALAERKSALEQELAAAKAESERKQTEMSSLLAAKASLEATLASEREATKEKLQLLSEARSELACSRQSRVGAQTNRDVVSPCGESIAGGDPRL